MNNLEYRATTASEAGRLEEDMAHPFRPGQSHSTKYFELLKLRRQLPVSAKRQDFLDIYHENQVTVVSGETGSGKTTQIPQFILFDEFASTKMIACTQPRRLAATSVAERVAAEMDVKLGKEEVGCHVRFDKRTNAKTRLSYMTDGMLLQLVKDDLYFQKYGCIIIDEVHERTLPTDILLALLKRALPHCPDLKVIFMSATANVGKFLSYFGQGKHFAISGREYPVDIRHLEEPTPDFFSLALHVAKHLHETSVYGDILIFMPSTSEIESACAKLREATRNLEVLPLYSQLPGSDQDVVFKRSTQRRCIISTNVAEASVTIDGVVYVIDTGLVNESRYNPRAGLQTILTAPISQASARQRAGRAGRTRPGVCYRLYTKDDFHEIMLPTTPPAILLSDLSEMILQIKAMGIDDVANFDFIDRPDPEVFFRALEDLLAMGYLSDTGAITSKGQKASKLPVHPAWYNALEKAHELGCSHPIFLRPHAVKFTADLARQRFACPVSDHITQLSAVEAYLQTEAQTKQPGAAGVNVDIRQWCSDAFLNIRALEEVKRIRAQMRKSFADLFKDAPRIANVESVDYDINIRKALALAFVHHVAFNESESGRENDHYRVLHFNWHAGIHPDSSLVGINHKWVIYDTFTCTGCQYLTTVTAIEPEWIMDSERFREKHWPTKNGNDGVQYRMPLAKASFDESREKHSAK